MTNGDTSRDVQTSVPSIISGEIPARLEQSTAPASDTSTGAPRKGRSVPFMRTNGHVELRYAPRIPHPDTGSSSTQA